MLLAKWLAGKFDFFLHYILFDLQLIRFKYKQSNTIHFFRYESPIPPSMEVFQESAVEAFPIAIVGFAVAFSVAKVYSIKHDYIINGNQVSYMW